MTSISLNTGLRALLSAQYVLDTIGHNIANANTPGYSRQRVQLASALALRTHGLVIGGGVDAGRVERSVNALLSRRILAQRSVMGGLEVRFGTLAEIESLFGEPGLGGLGDLIDGFFSAVSGLSTAPEDPIQRNGLVQSAESLTGRFRQIEAQLRRIGVDTVAEIEARVGDVNRYASEIATLNVEIAQAESIDNPANDLRDRRDMVLTELSKLVDLTTIEGQDGAFRVLVAGNALVGAQHAHAMTVETDATGDVRIRLAGSTGAVPVKGGAIGGLLELGQATMPELRGRLDELAHEFILGVNRAHSTGVPADGPFHVLIGTNVARDVDGDGRAVDELLSNSGLPFDVVSGALYVNVEEEATGEVVKHRVEISASHTTIQDFLDEMNAIPNLSADLDGMGRVRIVADGGYGFDFSRRLDPSPDSSGTFGGGRASLGALTSGPYALADGDTLDLTVDSGGFPVSFQISFAQADFYEISQATAEEIAAVVNADPNAQANGIVATAVGDTVVLQTLAEGSAVNFTVDGGTSVGALGWSGLVGAPIAGSDNAVDARIGGSYTGASDGTFVFRPSGDGVVGTTAGLTIDVFDANGTFVATLDVGDGYVPGTELNVADGVTVSFGLGDLSATHGDLFAVELVADSDTADVLVALGLNGFFEGSNAADIAVRADLAEDPDLIATSADGAPGSSAILVDLLKLESGFGGTSPGRLYGDLVSDIGFQVATTQSALVTNDALLDGLEQRRDAVSGVNLDEELVDLLAFEQAFAVAARYINVINQLSDEILSLL